MKKDKKQIESLIEKYFEGLTSLKEEQSLRDYFQQETIAQELEIYRPMFQFFSSEQGAVHRVPTVVHRVPITLYRWIGIAVAACLILMIGLKFSFDTQKTLPKTSQAYIDGKKYTNIERIQMEVIKSLEGFSEGDEEIYSPQIEALDFFLDNN
jgi:uncharacterized membrane protein YukC